MIKHHHRSKLHQYKTTAFRSKLWISISIRIGYLIVSTSVLVINCGSSSIKYALVSERREDRIFGLAENLGSADARIKGVTTRW